MILDSCHLFANKKLDEITTHLRVRLSEITPLDTHVMYDQLFQDAACYVFVYVGRCVSFWICHHVVVKMPKISGLNCFMFYDDWCMMIDAVWLLDAGSRQLMWYWSFVWSRFVSSNDLIDWHEKWWLTMQSPVPYSPGQVIAGKPVCIQVCIQVMIDDAATTVIISGFSVKNC